MAIEDGHLDNQTLLTTSIIYVGNIFVYCFEGQTQYDACGIELTVWTRIANETVIMKEGSRRLRNDSESHTTSLLDNRERNYRQSSVIVCSLLVYQTQNTTSQHGVYCSAEDCVLQKQ